MFSGGTPLVSNKQFYDNGNIPFIRSGEISSSSTELFITEEGLLNSSAKKVHKGDLLLALYGATSGNVAVSQISGAINQAVLCIRSKFIHPGFLCHLLTYNQSGITAKYLQGGQGNLSAEIIKSLVFRMPNKQEQLSITKTLDIIQQHISLVEKQISKYENIKKSTEKMLLTPKADWQQVRLGDIVDYYKGCGLSKEKLSSNGNYPCILYGELFTKYNEIIDEVQSKTFITEGFSSSYDDVLLPGSTTTCGEDLIKASAILQDDVLLGGDIIVLRPNKRIVCGRFLAYLISQYKKDMLKYTQGITIIHLQGHKMMDLQIKIPNLVVQRDIVNNIIKIDEHLKQLRYSLDKLCNIKTGMMSYFFG